MLPWIGHLVTLLSWLLLLHTASASSDWPESEVERTVGHYPSMYCSLTNIMLVGDNTSGVFYSTNDLDEQAKCLHVNIIWKFGSDINLSSSRCDETFDEGHIYTFYYYYGQSNYFHLHYDTAIPLFKSAYYKNSMNKRHAFLPTVETRRLEVANWETDAYQPKYEGKYWAEINKFIAGSHAFIPLDRTFLNSNKTLCFKKANFGTISWKKDNPMIREYVAHVLNGMGIQRLDPDAPNIGIIKRTNRRRILNEEQLTKALQTLAPTELVNFDGKTFREQVEMMQQYTVMVGMNGAGLMNCLYLPPSSVCVQLVPYKAHLNNVPYGELLEARGPYMEWQNSHEDMHVRRGATSHTDDTIVHVEEMKNVITEALELVIKTKAELKKDEL